MRNRRRQREQGGRIAVAIADHPREFVGIILAAITTLAIFVNALFLQRGPHPAPIFSSGPAIPPLVTRAPAPKLAAVPPPKAERNDPIAQLLAPSPRVLAVQRALADFGYGQIKPTGVADPDTKAAIEKFERSRHLPVTGQISDRLLRELGALAGRSLD